ncbi:MAG TPA: haloacid dehalogenase type II [Streptosporangiaceae bacterium]|nr:haloacid dehalogenase type II [Streptosporangiaceae bacterium]
MLCVFDVNETLLDLAALDGFFTELTGTPEARPEWFSLMIHSALTLTAARTYRPFGEIAAACLAPVAARHGRTATRDHQRELGERLRQLPAHPDAAAAIRRLRGAGFSVVTLTNSTTEVAEDQLHNAGLRDLIQVVYSADEVRMLKPAPEPYHHVLNSQHATPADTVLIAAHDWDIAGAAAAGLRTALITRDGQGPLPASESPAMSATSLQAIATELINRQPRD